MVGSCSRHMQKKDCAREINWGRRSSAPDSARETAWGGLSPRLLGAGEVLHWKVWGRWEREGRE